MSMKMNLKTIAKACKGKLHCEESIGTREIEGVVLDSRQVEKDYLFIATRGERVDGHQFIRQVFEKGALCVVCEQEPTDEVKAYILVEDSFAALREIAEYYRSTLDIKIVGITGSVGKTSTKEFIASVLEQKYKVLKTAGNFNNEIGVPLMVLKIRKEHEVAVLEMGINHFGEMTRLTQIVKPDICVMTNIGQCHLEFLGTREGILKAKSEIFQSMNPAGSVCVNGDDDQLQTIQQVNGKTPLRFGLSTEHNTIYASDIIDKGLFGSICNIHIDEEVFEANVPLPGQHMIYNALAATSVGSLLGLTTEEIAKGIAAVQPMGGRNNIIQTPDYVLIDDCYNANPVSMKSGLDLLANAKGRKVALIGDMMELGENANEFHTEIGAYVVEKEIDVLICVGTFAKYMQEGAGTENRNAHRKTQVYYFETRAQLMTQLSQILQTKDTILIKASHSMGFEEIVKDLR